MKLVDQNGKIYSSIREYCNKFGWAHSTISESISKKGFFLDSRTKDKLEPYYEVVERAKTPKIGQENPSQNEHLLKIIASRYSDDELKLLSKGHGLQDKNLTYPHICLVGQHHKIGVISDGHLGSKYSPIEFHQQAFNTFKQEK